MKCFSCNKSEMISEKVKYHYKESGLDNVYLDGIEISRCPSCDEEMVSIPSVPELHSLIGKNLIEKKSMLTGKEIRFLRKNAGLSAKKFSGMIGVDNTTVSRWENDAQMVSVSHDRFIRLFYAGIKGIRKEEMQYLINNEFENIRSVQETIPFTIPFQKWCPSSV